MSTPQEAPLPAATAPQSGADPATRRLQRATRFVLLAAALLLVYNLVAARFTPYTSQAYIQAFVVEIAPEVSGTVVSVDVRDNQEVKAGDPLFRVDPANFELAVQSAEAALAQAGQAIGSSTAQVSSAQAKLSAAEANLAYAREQSGRVLELVRRGIQSKAVGDQAQTALKTAQEEVNRARADLEGARQQLGPRGADNPQIRTATAQLENAQLDLIRSTVLAPADGRITNLKLSAGKVVSAGTPAITFIDTRMGWMVVELPERSIGRIDAGDVAEVVLDIAPGEVFEAEVESVGWGVSTGSASGSSGLPSVKNDNDWIREPQRFQVMLRASHKYPRELLRYGSRGSVVIYTGDHWLLNTIAALHIRIVSWLAYVL